MPPRAMIGGRPATDAAMETWVRQRAEESDDDSGVAPDRYAARLSVDVSREMRSRIKIAAFRRGSTVAKLLRQLLQREFGDDSERS